MMGIRMNPPPAPTRVPKHAMTRPRRMRMGMSMGTKAIYIDGQDG
jgi:hypothetical protein